MTESNFFDDFCGILPKKIGPGYLDQENLKAADKRMKERLPNFIIDDLQNWLDAEGERILNKDAERDRIKQAGAIIEQSGLGEKFRVRTFNTFDCNRQNREAWQACYDIASGKRKRGVTISGLNGIGKTHIAAAVVNALAERGHKARFANIVSMVKKIQSNFNTRTENVIETLLDGEVIVLDDLGSEHVKNMGWFDDLLYEILNSAYEDNKTVIITTNLTLRDLTRYSEAVNSRIAEMCEWIEYIDRDRRKTGEFKKTDAKTPFDDKEET